MKQYDANSNGVLERDEWSKMRGDPEKADKNGDKIITLDELTEHLAGFSARESSGTSSQGASASGSSRSGGSTTGSSTTGSSTTSRTRSSAATTGVVINNGSYRLLSAAERLPKGLPSWFLSKDLDGDGQVTMAEYSTVYNDAVAAEFMRYDLNGDGIITAEECLLAEKAKSVASAPSPR